MRLDRFLSEQTAHSRKDAQTAIRNGSVTLNGAAVRKADTPVQPETDVVTLFGTVVAYQATHYFLLHKPAGVLTATRDEKQQTVLDLLRPEDRTPHLSPCGRLDRDTTGFLLITDDGALTHRLLSPKAHIPKYYLVALRDPLHAADCAAFAAGIQLTTYGQPEPCKPAECAAIRPRLALLELREGKYHQVKRMFAARGNHVEQLMRVQMGGMPLPPNLAAGAYLVIPHKETALLLTNPCFSSVYAFCKEEYSSYWIN